MSDEPKSTWPTLDEVLERNPIDPELAAQAKAELETEIAEYEEDENE